MPAMIALLTDFGTTDVYVAEMKAAILSVLSIPVIDLCHDVAPGDIRHGQFLLATSRNQFPPGTIFVAVVDPGVGTSRPEVAVHHQDRWYVGPDNGLFSFAKNGDVFRIVPDSGFPQAVSRTFHGRDRFAPAAARIAAGDSRCLESAGELSVIDPIPWVTEAPGSGEIGHVDRFGNLVTTVSSHLARGVTISVHGTTISRWSDTFEEGGEAPFLVPGSRGMVEIAVNGGSAADILQVKHHDILEVKPI